MVSVEASTGTGTARSWMTGCAQSRITGFVAAQAALETLAVPIPAGVRYVDDILSLGVLGSVLQEIGCRFHDIASASEYPDRTRVLSGMSFSVLFILCFLPFFINQYYNIFSYIFFFF